MAELFDYEREAYYQSNDRVMAGLDRLEHQLQGLQRQVDELGQLLEDAGVIIPEAPDPSDESNEVDEVYLDECRDD